MIPSCNVCDRFTEVLDVLGVCGFCNDKEFESRRKDNASWSSFPKHSWPKSGWRILKSNDKEVRQ